jgi:iron(III) transport system permease protein
MAIVRASINWALLKPWSNGLPRVQAPAVVWLPAVLVTLAVGLPLVYLVIRAAEGSGTVGDVLLRTRTARVLGNTVLLTASVSLATSALAVALAWLTVRTDLPLRQMWSIISLLPLVIPSYVGGLVVVTALGPVGLAQQYLGAPLGIDRFPSIYGFTGAMLTLTLLSYPLVLLPVRAALQGIDPSLMETSRSLGLGAWATFFRAVLPQLRPAIASGTLLVALYTISDFGAVSLLRFETFTQQIFVAYESAFDRIVPAALSLGLVAVALGILALENFSRGRSRYYRSSSGTVRPRPPIALGRWRWPAFGFCTVMTSLALGLPIVVLGYGLIDGLSAGQSFQFLWGRALNSIYVSGLAAMAVLVAALPIAILTVRYPGRLSSLVERVAYLGFTLPHIVVALALVYFGSRFATPLYQTLTMLIFAYMALFLPVAIGALRASLLQVSPRIEEAARSLGNSPSRTFATITLPLLRPGILAALMTVFLVTMKELPATLLLSPTGFSTLATSIWSASSAAFITQASTLSLVLILVSAVPMVLLTCREQK